MANSDKNLGEIGPWKVSSFLIYLRAASRVKRACIATALKSGLISSTSAVLASDAIKRVESGELLGRFNYDTYQGFGSRTCRTIHEIAAEAAEVAPSSWRTGETAAAFNVTVQNIAILEGLRTTLSALKHFIDIIRNKEAEFPDAVKVGRVHLFDALPMSASDSFKIYREGLESIQRRLESEIERWPYSALGTRLPGCDLGSDPNYSKIAVEELGHILGQPIKIMGTAPDALNAGTELLLADALIQALSAQVWRTAHDLRIMASGPRGGLAEITLPAVAPGSSIMPGKLNPVMAEMTYSTVDQVDANHAGISMALKSGWLESTASTSIPMRVFLENCDLLSRSMTAFADLCIAGITINVEHCRHQAELSLGLAHAASVFFGHQTGKRLYETAVAEGISIRDAARSELQLSEAELSELFDIEVLSDEKRLAELFNRFYLH